MTIAREITEPGAVAPLAVDGGPPVRTRPLLSTPPVTAEDIRAATAVLESGALGGPSHPAVTRFEELLAAHAGVRHAAVVSSGTTAIHAILASLGVGPGDEVIVPAHTFIATATPVLMCGATPVVVDVDDETYCIDPQAVAAAAGPRTRAVVAVHINGHPAPVDRLPEGIPVVSDACQAHGATLFGTPVAALGVAGAYSFWQDKLLTAGGEGGAVLTADPELDEQVRLIRSHAQAPIPGTPNAHHVALGYNYRITGPQAAMGHSQLLRLPDLLAQRRRVVDRLTAALAGIEGITLPITRDGAGHVFWKYVVALDPAPVDGGLGAVVRALRAEGIAAAPRYPVPLGAQPVLTANGRIMPCPVADSLSERLLMLPLPAQEADIDDVDDVAAATRKVLAALRR